MSVYLEIARVARPTGRLLLRGLIDEGVDASRIDDAKDSLVFYGGRGYGAPIPTLNAMAGRANKLQQLEAFRNRGLNTPRFAVQPGIELRYPLLARTARHHGGRDIRPVFQAEHVAWRTAAGADYFVEYVPHRTEYRVWIFRRLHLATYEKVMRHPDLFTRIGGNHRNGFAFELVPSEEIPRSAVELASQAVETLGLDFGAADILEGTDGLFYLLEVNTAPGAEGLNRQGIHSLARHIAQWDRNGHPARLAVG